MFRKDFQLYLCSNEGQPSVNYHCLEYWITLAISNIQKVPLTKALCHDKYQQIMKVESRNLEMLTFYNFLWQKIWNFADQKSKYRTRAIIGHSWLEAALEYKPYIRSKVTVHKWSLEMG